MTQQSRTAIWALAISFMCVPGLAHAQSTDGSSGHMPLQKTIGEAKPEVVPSLIVMNSRGATLDAGKLTLTGVAPNSIVFADQPCGPQVMH